MDQTTLVRLMRMKPRASGFLDSMQGSRSGYYRYSYSGDLIDESDHWNLGSSAFALKIMYTLGRGIDEKVRAAARYALSFRNAEGRFSDAVIRRKSLPGKLRNALRKKSISSLSSAPYIRAETRQCYSALRLFNLVPDGGGYPFPDSEEKANEFLSALDWAHPWDAGSHFSHLMFFLRLAKETGRIPDGQYRTLVEFCLKWIARIQNPDDGFWYVGETSDNQKINGAMKIITGFEAIGHPEFSHADKIADFCLGADNAAHACDNLNVTLVLKSAQRQLGGYRGPDMESFALRRLGIFLSHYYEDYGGFSFYPRKSNEFYYGARITRGLDEPDIHGTVLLLWGISMLAKLLGIEDLVGLREFET